MTAELEAEIQHQQELVTKQGDTVRALKAELKEGKIDRVSSSELTNCPVLL